MFELRNSIPTLICRALDVHSLAGDVASQMKDSPP
jgi:hypothetical protein